MSDRVIDSAAALHGPVLQYWRRQESRYARVTRLLPDRLDQLETRLRTLKLRQGDALVAKVKECFHHGLLGMRWGDNQIKIFNAFLAACLPFIYGETWPEEKARVLREWGLQRERMYCLVNMARRNGKTMVTAGTVAALLLCVPGIKIAIFSTCKRTSQMLLTVALEQIEKAFELGTHADRADFTVITKNMESVIYEGPDGTKRQLGSFPGSVRVSASRVSRNDRICAACRTSSSSSSSSPLDRLAARLREWMTRHPDVVPPLGGTGMAFVRNVVDTYPIPAGSGGDLDRCAIVFDEYDNPALVLRSEARAMTRTRKRYRVQPRPEKNEQEEGEA